jgi:hypothetical protein
MLMIQLLNRLRFWAAKRCADCGGPIGQDGGPSDGWQLEDGRTVCHTCCRVDFRRQIEAIGTHK